MRQINKTIALLGAGWLGEPLAKRLLQHGYQVKVATTQADKAVRLRAEGLQTSVFQVQTKGIKGDVADFFQADQLVLTLPPGGRRDPAVEQSYPAKIRRVINAARAGGIQQLLFTSSTGIYGEQPGLVTEDSALQPRTASGKALKEVEQLLQESYHKNLTVLRLAGLAGGDRQPGRWFAGKQEVAGGEQPINLVHQQDVLAIMEQVLVEDRWGLTLNVSADQHPTKAEFYPLASRALGLEPPTFLTDFTKEPGKLVANTRSKNILNYTYQYPDPLGFPFQEK